MVRPLIEHNRDVTRTGLEAREWYGPLNRATVQV